jgi:hypothetical protein
MGPKAIARRLFLDYGLVANYQTIARRLQDLQVKNNVSLDDVDNTESWLLH